MMGIEFGIYIATVMQHEKPDARNKEVSQKQVVNERQSLNRGRDHHYHHRGVLIQAEGIPWRVVLRPAQM